MTQPRSADEWLAELPCGIDTDHPYPGGADFIRAIQRDACAAEFARAREEAAGVCDARAKRHMMLDTPHIGSVLVSESTLCAKSIRALRCPEEA